MQLLLLIFPLFLSQLEAAKILVYSPLFAHSHVKFLASISEILTEEGHDVTVVMPVLDVSQKNKTCLTKTKKVIIVDEDQEVAEFFAHFGSIASRSWVENQGNPFSKLDLANNMSMIWQKTCDKLMQQTTLLNQLKNEKFDLGIAEPFTQCGLAFINVIGIKKHISVLSTTKFDHVSRAVGQPCATSFVPGLASVYSDQMTLKQRLLNTVQSIVITYLNSMVAEAEMAAVWKYHPDVPDWNELIARSTFILPNTIPFLDFPAPTLSKIVPIGGISVNVKRSANKLPEKWDKVLNERSHTVFISFGSIAKSITMPPEFKKSLVQLFTSMPDVTFIWKYENETDTMVDHLENVHLGAWLPQTDLLADKRLSLFITHGGLGSTMELSAQGKPSIMIPLFADQYRNAQMLSRHGGALVLAKEQLADFQILKDAIEKILKDGRFAENAEKLANVLQNQPTNARETLVKHIEFAARFGQQPHTDPYGRKLNIFQYYLIDVIALTVAVLFTIVILIYKTAKTLLYCIYSVCGRKLKVE